MRHACLDLFDTYHNQSAFEKASQTVPLVICHGMEPLLIVMWESIRPIPKGDTMCSSISLKYATLLLRFLLFFTALPLTSPVTDQKMVNNTVILKELVVNTTTECVKRFFS